MGMENHRRGDRYGEGAADLAELCDRVLSQRPLILVSNRGPVEHHMTDGRAEPHGEAMDRLLDLQKLPREDLYATREELIATAIARQSERVAHVGDEPAARTVDQVS